MLPLLLTCPTSLPPATWGTVADTALDEVSGLVSSRLAPDVWWVHEDSGNAPALVSLDATGATLARHELPPGFTDFEDMAGAVDPESGTSLLFLGDIGDNAYARGEVAVWIVEEPDPFCAGAMSPPQQLRLTYPGGPRNAETLLVDPITLDLFVITKDSGGPASVFVKRAPHVAGPSVLEDLGQFASLDLVATGGDVSEDGSRVVVRDYTETARLWLRDPTRPLEDTFRTEPCTIPIAGEQQGEAIGFTTGGSGLITISEGTSQPLHYIELQGGRRAPTRCYLCTEAAHAVRNPGATQQ